MGIDSQMKEGLGSRSYNLLEPHKLDFAVQFLLHLHMPKPGVEVLICVTALSPPHPHLGCRAVKGGIRVPDPVPPAKFYGLLMELQVVRDPEDGQKRGDWLPLQRGMG